MHENEEVSPFPEAVDASAPGGLQPYVSVRHPAETRLRVAAQLRRGLV